MILEEHWGSLLGIIMVLEQCRIWYGNIVKCGEEELHSRLSQIFLKSQRGLWLRFFVGLFYWRIKIDWFLGELVIVGEWNCDWIGLRLLFWLRKEKKWTILPKYSDKFDRMDIDLKSEAKEGEGTWFKRLINTFFPGCRKSGEKKSEF